jgi:diacylglycerol kinase family enzyme
MVEQTVTRGPWVAIQINPWSGAGGRRAEVLELMRALRNRGFRPRVFSNRERLDAWLRTPGRLEQLRCLVAAGGDGTLRDICNRHPGVPIGLFPLGTENLVARYLKIPTTGREAADVIASGDLRRLDLGLFHDRRFAIMASAGFDAEVIHTTHARRTGHIQRADYLQPIWDSLRTYPYPEMRIWVDERAEPYRARLAVLVNLPAYALGLQVASDARGDDGLFDLRLFEQGSTYHMFRYFLNVAWGTHEGLADVQRVRGRRFRFEADVPIPLQVDGDPAGMLPAEFSVLPGELHVYAPREG